MIREEDRTALEEAYAHESKLYTKIWNAALDEAIKIATIERKYIIADEIRKLKK